MRRFLPAAAMWLCCVAPLAAVVHPDPLHDPLLQLPTPPLPHWQPTAAPTGTALFPSSNALRIVAGKQVLIDGFLNMDKGPADGMEVVACTRDGKCHEAIMRLDLSGNQGHWVKFACISALKLEDGIPAVEGSGLPARGTPVRLRIYWHDEDEGSWKVIDASCLIRDRDMDKAYPPLPFIYTGSRTISVIEADPNNGRPIKRDRFMLDSTRSVAVAYDEPDALLASPFPGSRENARFEAASNLTPPVGAHLVLSIEPATLPLTLMADEQGALSQGGTVLDDAHLARVLGQVYSALPPDALRAVAIQVPKGADPKNDATLRARVLAAAATAKVWVIPVFSLRGG